MSDTFEYMANMNGALFNPLFWDSLMFISISFYYTGFTYAFINISIVSITFISIIPLIVVHIWSRYKKANMDLTNRKDRNVPLLISTICFLICIITLYLITDIIGVIVLMFAYFCNLLLIYLITYKWKISIHAIVVSSPIPFIIHIWGYFGFLFLIILLITTYSRLYLRRHTVAQLLAGASLGMIISTLIILFALKLNLPI